MKSTTVKKYECLNFFVVGKLPLATWFIVVFGSLSSITNIFSLKKKWEKNNNFFSQVDENSL